MESESAEDIWALVQVGPKFYMGTVQNGGHAYPGSVFELAKVCEVTSMILPAPGPEGRPVFHKEISCDPFILSFEGSMLRVKPDLVLLFSEMKTGDRRRYKALVDRAEQVAQQARAASIGLTLPGQ